MKLRRKKIKETKYLSDTQGDTNKILIEMVKTIQGFRTKFSEEIETLKRTQPKMNMELENPIIQLENSQEVLQVERIKQKIEHQNLKIK